MLADPSLQTGYVELYQREVNMTIKSESMSFQDEVMARVFMKSQSFKVELTS